MALELLALIWIIMNAGDATYRSLNARVSLTFNRASVRILTRQRASAEPTTRAIELVPSHRLGDLETEVSLACLRPDRSVRAGRGEFLAVWTDVKS